MERKPKNIFVEGPISTQFIADSIAKHQSQHQIGAHALFLGQVRADASDKGITKAIIYTAYTDMALQKAFEIREDIFAKYAITCMHLHHSIGVVPVGLISLFVFTSSAHRHEAINACNELVERIKKEVPIWGKEILDDDTYRWKTNTM